MARLVLVGLPGVGKTTVARALAERWGSEALDTDDVLAADVGVPAAQYLRDQGEANFRARELDALRLALGENDTIVATGGGIVCTAEARDALSEELTLWLDCDDDVILTRLGDGDRPLLAEGPAAGLVRLRGERESGYREVSRARVDTSAPLDEVVTRVTREVDRLTQ